MADTIKNSQSRLITYLDSHSPIAEAYRTLRTNIQFADLDNPLRSLLVTSSGPEEGKSTTLANLALAMAQNDMQVIIVDCDLRRPSQHKLFNLTNGNGLTNLLIEAGKTDLLANNGRACLPFLQETSLPNLRLLASGPIPPNPAELLGSKRMEQVIQALSQQAEFILVDAPPVLAVTDAALLARRVDGTLLVVESGKCKRDLARKAKAQLERVNARIIGVVLNNVKESDSLYQYGNGQG